MPNARIAPEPLEANSTVTPQLRFELQSLQTQSRARQVGDMTPMHWSIPRESRFFAELDGFILCRPKMAQDIAFGGRVCIAARRNASYP